MAIGIIVAIVLVILFYVLATYNGLVGSKNIVDEAFSTMDVYLKKRWDLIPNLVETVKGYAKHESETLEKVIALRNGAYNNMSVDEKMEVNKQLSSGISKLIAVAESYPDLKANQNFTDLSKELSKIEEDIANSRKYYNGTVRNFNNKVMMFPGNIVANMFGFKKANMFEAAEEEKKNVKVEF
mgnify:FL=1